MNKKMVSFQQDARGVTIHCADGTSYGGDVLVGADGTYSSVRENLYRDLKAKGKLPKSDAKPLPFRCICLVGQTEVLDPKEFPQLTLPQTEFNSVLGNQKDYNVRRQFRGPPSFARMRYNVLFTIFCILCLARHHYHKAQHYLLG